jgi:hypothetical protein
MKTVKDAIKRDGLALARVPPKFEEELTRFGGQDPTDMLKFRAYIFPRDISSWRIAEVCILAVAHRLESRIYRISQHNSINGADSQIGVNGFRDILITLWRRQWQAIMEIDVYILLLSNFLECGSL